MGWKEWLFWLFLILLVFMIQVKATMILTSTDASGYTYYNTETKQFTRQQFVNPINVWENGEWVYFTQAKSLKSIWTVKFLKIDSNFPLQILDYNFTHIVVNISSAITGSIPFQWCKEVCLDAKDCSKGMINQCNNVTVAVSSISRNQFQVFTIAIPDATQYKNLTWGTSSTTIQFTNGNVFDDAMVGTNGAGILDRSNYGGHKWIEVSNSTSGSQRDYEGYLKFNTTLPAGVTLIDAEMGLTIVTNALTSGYSQVLSSYHVYNDTLYSWWEGTEIGSANPECGSYSNDNDTTSITWNNKPVTSSQMNLTKESSVNITSSSSVGSVQVWNVTNAVMREYATNTATNRANVTIGLRVTGIGGDTNYLTFCIIFNSSEASAGKPYLNVTYTEGGAVQHYYPNVTSTCTYSELAIKKILFVKSMASSAAYAEYESRLLVLTRAISSSAKYVEVINKSALHPRGVLDSLSYSDSLSKFGMWIKSVGDSLSYNEVVGEMSAFERWIEDSMTYADLTGRNFLYNVLVYSSTAYNEFVIRQLNLIRNAYGSIGYNEIVRKSALFIRQVSDYAMYVEIITTAMGQVKSYLVSVLDSLGFGDIASSFGISFFMNAVAQTYAYVPPLVSEIIVKVSDNSLLIGGMVAMFGMVYWHSKKKVQPNPEDELINEEFGEE